MTRPARLAFVVLAALAAGACSQGEPPRTAPPPEPVAPPPATPPPIPVHVAVPEEPGPGVEQWVQALEAAVAAGHGHLRLAGTPEEALVVVRLDAVDTGVKVEPEPPGEGEVYVVRGALVLGESAREFSLAYRGDARPQAEALARNLRQFAAERVAPKERTGASEVPSEDGAETPEDEDQG